MLLHYLHECNGSAIICLLDLLICSTLLDDGEHAATRGGHCAIEKYQPGKGNFCEAAAPHQGLLRHLQSQSNVGLFIGHILFYVIAVSLVAHFIHSFLAW